MKRAAGVLLTSGLLLLVSLSGALPVAAHDMPEVGGRSAWCATRVSNVTAGSSFSWWSSCRGTAALAGGSFTLRTAWDVNGVDEQRSVSSNTPDVLDGTKVRYSGSSTWADAPGTTETMEHGFESYNLEAVAHSLCGPDPYGQRNQLSNGCSAAGTDKAGRGALTIGGTGHPPYPLEGGGAPPTPDTKCSVDLDRDDGVYRARFSATLVDTANGAATWAWTFGDGGTSTQEDPQHTYVGPDNAGAKWIATVVATREGVSDTCTITFDFHGDSHVDGDSGGEDSEDEGCSLLPHKFIVCWMKKLFVPEGGRLQQELDALAVAANSNWPIGPVTWAVSEAVSAKDTFNAGAGPAWMPARENAQGLGPACGVDELAIKVTVPEGGEPVRIPFLTKYADPCPVPGDEGPWAWVQRAVWLATSLLFVFLIVSGLVSIANHFLGRDGGGSDE